MHDSPPGTMLDEPDLELDADREPGEPQGPPLERGLVVAVTLLATLADVTLFRSSGFAGPAVFLVAAPLLMLPVGRRRRFGGAIGLAFGLLVLLAARLLWCGSAVQIVVGFGVLSAFAMALSGQRPYVLRTFVFVTQTFMSGYAALYRQWRAVGRMSPRVTRTSWWGVVLPVAAVLMFGTLFVFANPNLVRAFGEGFANFAENVSGWFRDHGPRPAEVVFWLAAAWVAAGALRPLMRETLAREGLPGEEPETVTALEPVPHPLFEGCRNTLVAVVVLFAAYLVFEFRTLWFREFPEGFHYSGYAHRGAFWLTMSLALATAVLSAVFQGELLDDPRIRSLRRLAWVWSFENLLLAVSVFNRLWIYVGYNGMTRMRVVGFLGTTAVVAGFVLVLVKIAARHDFVWLVRRQLWALAACVVLYAVMPVDGLVMGYNVRRVLAGDHAPAVQISRHPIDDEGMLQLFPLLDHEDDRIRAGIGALLAERRYGPADSRRVPEAPTGWTAWQWSRSRLNEEFANHAETLAAYEIPAERHAWRRVFDDYTYQWW